MNTTAEQPEHTATAAPAPWCRRWYSAAKRFGIAVLAVTVLDAVVLLVSAVWHLAPRPIIGPLLSLTHWAPPIAVAWGLISPREYPNRPSAGARTGVALLGATGIAISVSFVVLIISIFSFFVGPRVDCEEFTPEVWNFCHDQLHLAQDADLRPVGFRLVGFQDYYAQVKFLTGEPDPARLFDTNAVDLSEVRPGGDAGNIRPPSGNENGRARSSAPRWWTPSEEHVVSGSVNFRDANRHECMEIAVDALPDGTHALYISWYQF